MTTCSDRSKASTASKPDLPRASGFNLVTSVHRDGRYLLGVVLGGRSASERDAHMRELISEHFKEASLQRTAPVIAEQSAPHEEPRHEPQQVAFAKAPMSTHGDPVPAPAAAPIRAAARSRVLPQVPRTQPAPPTIRYSRFW